MVRRASKKKAKKLPMKCPECGAPQLTVWMSSGAGLAVDPGKIEVIFTNMANAGGHRMSAHVEHRCEKEKA